MKNYYISDTLIKEGYSSGGSLMPERNFFPNKYAYSINGQRNEADGSNLHLGLLTSDYTSAEFWEYDSRALRRWNTDPIVKPWESSYACFRSNPIYYADPSGLDGEGKGGATTISPNDGSEKSLGDMMPNFERGKGSTNNSSNGDLGRISTGYFGIDRTQIGGNTSVKLKSDFNYIRPSTGQRFAPDEPSSFYHLKYKFPENNSNIDIFTGGFRNHTKGDFLLGNGNDVHFGKGNSQIGFGLGMEVSTPSFKGFFGSTSLFVGAGPQFVRFESSGNIVSPGNWGIRGFGEIAVIEANLTTPNVANVFSITFSVNTLVHHATFGKFSVTNGNTGNTTNYSGVNFTTVSNITPTIQLNFKLSGKR